MPPPLLPLLPSPRAHVRSGGRAHSSLPVPPVSALFLPSLPSLPGVAWGLIAPPEEQEFGNLCAHLWTDAKYRARRRCVASCGVMSTRRFARAPVLLTSMCRYDPDWSLEYPHQTANGAESASSSGWSELIESRFEPKGAEA